MLRMPINDLFRPNLWSYEKVRYGVLKIVVRAWKIVWMLRKYLKLVRNDALYYLHSFTGRQTWWKKSTNIRTLLFKMSSSCNFFCVKLDLQYVQNRYYVDIVLAFCWLILYRGCIKLHIHVPINYYKALPSIK